MTNWLGSIVLTGVLVAGCGGPADPEPAAPQVLSEQQVSETPDDVSDIDELGADELPDSEIDYSALTELMTMSEFQTMGPSEQTLRAVDACVDENGISRVFSTECIGLIIDTCPEDAVTTADMVRCIDYEQRYWEDRLAATRDLLLGALGQDDALMGAEGMIPVNLTAEFLRADAAWQDYRASTCQFEALRFRGGTLGRVTGASCMNRMTANRAIDLGVLLETYLTD